MRDSDRGHSQDYFIVCLPTAAPLVVAVSLGAPGLVIVHCLHLRHHGGFGLDDVLLPPPPLLAVLQVLLPLVPRPELPHLDLAGGVVVRGEAAPLLRDLLLSLPQQEGPGWSPGDVAAAVRSDLKHHNLSVISQKYQAN